MIVHCGIRANRKKDIPFTHSIPKYKPKYTQTHTQTHTHINSIIHKHLHTIIIRPHLHVESLYTQNIMGQEKSVPIRCNTCHSYSSSIKKSASLSASTSQLPTSSQHQQQHHHHKTAPSPVRSQSRSTTISTKSSHSSKKHASSHTRLSSRHSSASATSTTSSSYKSIDNQTKYLNHQLYIKSYLDIVEEDRNAAIHFQPARNGIRNYTPKILLEQSTPPASTSASSTSSNEQEDIDIWI